MKPRTLEKTIRKAIKTFPALVVTGPRQAGKTTLLRNLFAKTHRFVSLENPDTRIRAQEDPLGFLEENSPPVILDEIQYVPELLSYIKTKIDEKRKPGQWFFTGSQNFTLMQEMSQSLAGRIAVLSLLPFSYAERIGRGRKSIGVAQWLKQLGKNKSYDQKITLHELILRGNYPEIASKKSVDRRLWCSSYIATYLERDVRNLSQIGDLNQFERFLRLCATRTGQILNLTDMARDIGISTPTAKRWLSVLETGYQVYLLYPYYRNIGKRFIKSPKLYFSDTALASYLLGIHEKEVLLKSPQFGNLFETFIMSDMVKRFLHFGQLPSLYYLRTRDGLEIDLIIEIAGKLHLFEIKSTMTVTPKHAQSLSRMKRVAPKEIAMASLISSSHTNYSLPGGIMNYSWRNILKI